MIDIHRQIKRAGETLNNVLKRTSKIITAEDALLIFNTYGCPLEWIILMAYSHNITVDEEGFSHLLNEQIEISRNMKQCCVRYDGTK